jgi:hypothetical protein
VFLDFNKACARCLILFWRQVNLGWAVRGIYGQTLTTNKSAANLAKDIAAGGRFLG